MMAIPTETPARRVWLLLDSQSVGGIETHVAVLAAGLRAAGQWPTVVFWRDYGHHPLRARLEADSVPWMCLGGTLASLMAGLRRHRPDVLHTHGYKAGILGRLVGRLAAVPVVSTFHAGEPGSGRVRLYNQLDRLTAPLAHCIAVSELIRSQLPATARTIGNFLAVPPVTERDRATAGVVAFVGRLSPEKGPDIFCRIASACAPDIPFAIFGDGPMRGALESAFGARVTFHGMVDMTPHWSAIGLLCMPSRHEGLPMAALEAMAQGVPVAAFAVGALPDLIVPDETGWIAAPGDEAGLTAAVEGWARLSEDRRGVLADNARRRIEARHSVTRGVQSVLGVYAAALG